MGLHAALDAPWLKAMVLMATPLRVDLSERSRLQEALGLLHPTVMPTLTEASVDHLLGILMNPVRFSEEETYSLLDRECYESVGKLIEALDPLGKAAQLAPIPTRLIHGEWDNVVPIETAYQLLNALPGPADLVTIPRKNHLTLLFHQPTATAACEWFEDHL
ncbi:Alpha/beta hydrolase family protein [compost metagenome]